MKRQLIEASLNPSSPRAADWEKVFLRRHVPILSPVAHVAVLPGLGEREVYLIDLAVLGTPERLRLVRHLSERFGIPLEEADADLDAAGCPILAEDVVISGEGDSR